MPFKKGASGNPGGRPRHSPELQAAKAALLKITPSAVRVLYDLLKSDDEKVALTAATAVLKITVGDMVRAAVDDDGKTVGKIDAEEIAQRARTLIAARLLVAPSHEVEYQSAKEKSK